MKTPTVVQGKPPRGLKPVPRQRTVNDPRYKLGNINPKRQKLVQSVVAGHVRGGHSFH